jgi:hypothetical protein
LFKKGSYLAIKGQLFKTRSKGPILSRKGGNMKRLKNIWALVLRKAGVSIHDRIFTIKIDSKLFVDILAKRRTAIIIPWDWEFETGGLVRLREYSDQANDYTNREAHLFINEIIGPNDTSFLLPGFCVLVLG